MNDIMPREVRTASSHHNRMQPYPIQIPQQPHQQPRQTYPQQQQQQQPQQSHQPSTSPPSRSAQSWSPQDDETLIQARQSGLNWQPIASRYFPSKTANACRKRHERLMERRNANDWDGVKFETLALEYINMRKELWTPLADKLGEKWTVVEQKCMENGLKNLLAAHRSASKKQQGADFDAATKYDGTNYEGDDSGIAMSDAEHEIDDGSGGRGRTVSLSGPSTSLSGPSATMSSRGPSPVLHRQSSYSRPSTAQYGYAQQNAMQHMTLPQTLPQAGFPSQVRPGQSLSVSSSASGISNMSAVSIQSILSPSPAIHATHA